MKKLIYSSLLAVLMAAFCASDSKAQDQNKVYSFVDVQNPPTYPGGIKKFYEFLGENIKYPADARENKIQGNVFISFTVETDGSITDARVDKGLSPSTDEEAMRVLKIGKRWNPGMINSEPVRVRYSIPIKFSLNTKKN